MQLGAFSISLAVKDLEASKRFYEKFGFFGVRRECRAEVADPEERGPRHRPFSRDVRKEHSYLQPGWDQNAQALGSFTDVRDLQRAAKGTRCAITARGGREDHRARQLHRGGPRRQIRSSSISTCKLAGSNSSWTDCDANQEQSSAQKVC